MRKLIIISFLVMIFYGCTTTNNINMMEIREFARPTWIDKYPANNDYYIGIGTSNTGNESEDREIAEERALTNVAASISTKLMSETEIRTEESSTSEVSESFEEKITAVVEQSLSGVETVDIYYSEQSGAWVYLRLSKELWEDIKRKEMEDLISRISEFLEPSLSDTNRTLSSKIKDLIKAKQLIYESPYRGMLKTTLLDESGSLTDIIDTKISELLDTISLETSVDVLEMEVGQTASLSANVKSNSGIALGSIPLALVTNKDSIILSSYTDNEGVFNSEVKTSSLSVGQNYVSLTFNRDELGMDNLFNSLNLPEKTLIIDLQTLSIGLEVNIDRISGAVKSIFSSKSMPFKFGDVKSTYLDVQIQISDYPRINDSAPYMSKAKAVISLVENGNVLYSYESKGYKDGGITIEQAHERATDKLLKNIKSDGEFVKGISESLSIN